MKTSSGFSVKYTPCGSPFQWVFDSLFSSSYIGIIYGEENREPKTHWNRFETPPNAVETRVIHRRWEGCVDFIKSLSPILNDFVRSFYSHTNSYKYNAVTQCHVDGSLWSLGYLWEKPQHLNVALIYVTFATVELVPLVAMIAIQD